MNPPISEAAAEALREPGRGLPVFASADGRRRRVLRLAGRVIAGLTALWLVALVAGALGLGDLPGVSLPNPAAGDDAETSAPAPAEHRAQPRGAPAAKGSSRGDGGAREGDRSGSTGSPTEGSSPGAPVRRQAAPGGVSRGRAGSGTTRPTAPSAPASPPATAPGHSTAPPTTHGVGPEGSGPPAGTYSPGAGQAQPSPAATEHSHRWGSDGG